MISGKARHEFRSQWKYGEVCRIEALSDAVFAFAVTLLIVSLEVPRTATELREVLRGFFPFAITFAMLLQIWYAQFIWFRRYGLQDMVSTVLNAVLIFVVLFYVYPLKFLFTYLISSMLGGDGMAHFPDGHVEPMLKSNDTTMIMGVYDAGFIAVFAVFALLYLHAWHRRDDLGLSRAECLDALTRAGANVCFIGIGVLSLTILFVAGSRGAGAAGLAYFLIAPVLTIFYTFVGRHRRKADEIASRKETAQVA